MIIFDLDGTLADCEHRRHFVKPFKKEWEEEFPGCFGYIRRNQDGSEWESDYRSFYESCCEDKPNIPIIVLFRCLYLLDNDLEIWSGRCESVRAKTLDWLEENLLHKPLPDSIKLRMRPIGDSTPDDELKEKWLDEYIAGGGKEIEMVFDDRDKVVAMWRRRGITCLQVAPGDF